MGEGHQNGGRVSRRDRPAVPGICRYAHGTWAAVALCCAGCPGSPRELLTQRTDGPPHAAEIT